MSPKTPIESRADVATLATNKESLGVLPHDSLQSAASTQLSGDTPDFAYTPTPSSSSRAGTAGTTTRSSRTSVTRERTTTLETPREIVLKYCKEKEGSVLKAWFHHFDREYHRKIHKHDFQSGMRAVRYPGNIDSLWEDLCRDAEGTGHDDDEFGLEDLDEAAATVWNKFRRWCGATFSSARDLIRQCKQSAQNHEENPLRRGSSHDLEILYEAEFLHGISDMTSEKDDDSIAFQGHEEILFKCIDQEQDGVISSMHLKWMELEVRRHRQKEAAKRKAQRMAEHKAQGAQAMQVALEDFKATLRKHAGSLFKAWRRLLDPDGSMSVQRADLFKVCQKLNWKGDVRALWKALDHDNSHVSTLEELHPHGAQLLAQFKLWANANFGPKPAAAMFHTFDKQNLRKLRYAQFMNEVQARGFERKCKTLVLWLDWEDKKCLHEEDFAFLDHWKPPPWLTAQPSYFAAQAFKSHLLHKYGHMLKAWRAALDKDNSNCCNWHEFQEAARHIKFTGDVAEAWLCFDRDMSGYISLKEIDEQAHDSLSEFKQWADDEFGGVRSAFKVLDVDGSGELTYREFRGACRNFGFHGDIRSLFESLDQHGEHLLQYKEVAFLDDWETKLPVTAEGMEFHQEPQKELEQAPCSALIDYVMESPGPGAYDVLPGFGATPYMPTARHGGAYSFTTRRIPKLPKSVGPARYEPSLKSIVDRKPCWSFGSASREYQSVFGTPRLKPRSSSVQEETMPAPGPGSYEMRSTFSGPRYSMKPRRVLRLHPSERARAISR